ncbi:MAG TPA: ABC transporter permease subunit [Acidimicrobiia bacterium]|nr:ABC transporter permease subunit [Acidimicrobiia bacterium]
MTDLGLVAEPARPLPQPRELTPGHTPGDRVFRFLSAAAAAGVLAILGLVALFLVLEARPAINTAGLKFFTTFEWNPDGTPARFGIAALVYGTVVIAGIALIPFFHTDRPVFGSSMFIAGIVVGLMVLPIVASVTREVLAQAPRGVCEAALALGGSRWGMIRSVILPFGRRGIVVRRLRRRPHRQPLRGGRPGPASRAGGGRPGPVRDHPDRQHRRPAHRQPDQPGNGGGLTWLPCRRRRSPTLARFAAPPGRSPSGRF